MGTVKCLVYIGLPTNPQFLGSQTPEDIAKVIRRSKGPSGENSEYLFMLESALEGLGEGSGDEHVSLLASRVRAVKAGERAKGTGADSPESQAGVRAAWVIGDGAASETVSDKLDRMHSHMGCSHKMQEETEKR